MTEEDYQKKINDASKMGECFSFGVNWSRKNPAPEVLKLVTTLKFIRENSLYFDANDLQLHQWISIHQNNHVGLMAQMQMEARSALAEFEKATGGE